MIAYYDREHGRETRSVRLESRRGDAAWGVRSRMNTVNAELHGGKITLRQAESETLREAQRWNETVRDGSEFRVVVE